MYLQQCNEDGSIFAIIRLVEILVREKTVNTLCVCFLMANDVMLITKKNQQHTLQR